MEQNNFFKWVSRINSVLFLLLLLASVFFVFYEMFESASWQRRNAVEVVDKKTNDEGIEDLRLSDITKICGKDIQYVKLMSSSKSRGFSSGGYGRVTRNIVFFVGEQMESNWLYDTNKYLINEVNELKKTSDDCKSGEAVSIYYEVIKTDTNGDGSLDNNDEKIIALTSLDGGHYTEIDSGLSSVIDSSINKEATELTVLAQKGNSLIMEKFSLLNYQKISEREISRIEKRL